MDNLVLLSLNMSCKYQYLNKLQETDIYYDRNVTPDLDIIFPPINFSSWICTDFHLYSGRVQNMFIIILDKGIISSAFKS